METEDTSDLSKQVGDYLVANFAVSPEESEKQGHAIVNIVLGNLMYLLSVVTDHEETHTI